MELLLEFLKRVILSIGIGAMIGLEREYSAKQQTAGIRSFALVSFLGCLIVLLSQSVLFELPFEFAYLPYVGFVMVVIYSFLVFYFLAQKKETFGLTTTLALPLAYLFGMFVGFGFFMEAIIAAVIVTILLYSRRYSHVFVENLSEHEVADALQFAIVLFVIYPLLPVEPVSFFGIQLMLKRLVEVIILVSLISFAGFISLRIVGNKALPVTGFLGGFVSSLSVVASFSNMSKKRNADCASLASGILAANTASLLGDALILLVANYLLFAALAPAISAMLLVLAFSSLLFGSKKEFFKPNLDQPFSVVSATKFALAFFAVSIVLELVSGLSGAVYLVSFLTGMVSVTPVVVSLAFEAGAVIPTSIAVQSIVLAIIAGMIVKVGVLFFSAAPALRNRVAPILVLTAIIGAAAILLTV